MKQTLQEVFSYLKDPVPEKYENTDLNYRLQKLGHLLIICFLTGILFIPVFILIEKAGLVNMGDHAMEDMMKRSSKGTVFFLVVILAPLF